MLEQQLRHDIQRSSPCQTASDMVQQGRTMPERQLFTQQLMMGFQIQARPLNYPK